MLNPASMPPLNGCLRRGVFLSHIYRRPLEIQFRGVKMKAAQSQPSAMRKASIAGYTEEIADIEIMIALGAGAVAPTPNSTDEVRIYSTPVCGQRQTYETYKDYCIISAQTDIAPDCYQLSLSLRRK